jgi:hypothetical protein
MKEYVGVLPWQSFTSDYGWALVRAEKPERIFYIFGDNGGAPVKPLKLWKIAGVPFVEIVSWKDDSQVFLALSEIDKFEE